MMDVRQEMESNSKKPLFSFHSSVHGKTLSPQAYNTALIALLFLLTSTGWLSWEYHLLNQTEVWISDAMTMGVGYLLQAGGITAFSLLLRRNGKAAGQAVPVALLLHILCLIPACVSDSFAVTLASGLLMNLFCGFLCGFYLYSLTRTVPAEKRGIVLGFGYSVSILLSWLLSRIGGFYYSNKVWILCLLLTVLTGLLIRRAPARAEESPESAGQKPAADPAPWKKPLFLLAGSVVLLFSIVNNCAFGFSAADLVQGINVETSRLFYAAGLIIAGWVSDRDRKHGAVAALSALIIPFLMLALRREPLSLTIFWALNYLSFGFYSVFRMIVFTDLSEKNGCLWLAGAGLLVGRIGDAAGEAVHLSLASVPTALVFLAAILSVAAVFLFFRIYRPLYVPDAERKQTEQERFYQFAVQHDLSARERDILRLVLEGKTNGEIAENLSISENTVKFHIRNLLQKTGRKKPQRTDCRLHGTALRGAEKGNLPLNYPVRFPDLHRNRLEYRFPFRIS